MDFGLKNTDIPKPDKVYFDIENKKVLKQFLSWLQPGSHID